MGSNKDLEKGLLSGLEGELKSKGFKRKLTTFSQATAWGSNMLHLAIRSRADGIEVSMDLAVRHDALETLVFQPDPLISEKEKVGIATLGADVGYLTQGKIAPWRLSSEFMIEGTTAAIAQVADLVAFPFFERFNSLEAILDLLSRDDLEADHMCPLSWERARRALGAAYLLGRREQFHDLMQAKSNYMERTRARSELRSVRAFAEQLLSRWPTDT